MPRDPVDAMLGIAEKFLRQAEDFDRAADGAVDQNAAAADIRSLLDLGATFRLRALSAFQAASPYCRPRLAAVELSPASATTVDRFQSRISAMDEGRVIEHLKVVAAGGSALQLLEAEDDG